MMFLDPWTLRWVPVDLNLMSCEMGLSECGPNFPSGKKPHSDKQLTGLRPDRDGRKWRCASLKNE
jgi:hypothetical protein